MTGLDGAFDRLRVVGHDGYRDGEQPVYRECPLCLEPVRADRTDLAFDHLEACVVRNRLRARGITPEVSAAAHEIEIREGRR